MTTPTASDSELSLRKSEVPASAPSVAKTVTATRPKSSSGSFIPEIQGLRTIALLLVATFHIWFDKVSGGVDVFLLISAYLMTRSLTARAERGVHTNPLTFLITKFARLLPAAVITISLTVVAVLLVFPPNFWSGFLREALASLGYFQNIRLQELGTNYFNATSGETSPFQHFWSLSIQGQVFILWAVLHLAAELFARVTKIPVRWVLLTGFSLIFIVSLARSIWLTDFNQAFAYFDTWARLWEFAAGSLLALVHPLVRVGKRVRTAMGWAGLAGILSCAFLAPVESSFPGYMALWPVLSAALVILSAGTPTHVGSNRLLSAKALGNVGKYTYALYLTHWPVLIFFLATTNEVRANWWQGTIILGISAALSFAIYHLVEQPVAGWLARGNRPRAHHGSTTPHQPRAGGAGWVRSATAIAAAASLAGITIFAGFGALRSNIERAHETLNAADHALIGANNPGPAEPADIVPAQVILSDDWVDLGRECAPDDPHRTAMCYEFPAASGFEQERVIFNVGNSHSTQFAAVLLETAERQPTWSVRSQVAPGCNYQFSLADTASDDCRALWHEALGFIASEQPDLVVVYGTWAYANGDIALEPLHEWLAEAQPSSPQTTFLVVRDNPRLHFSPSECAFRNGFEHPDCISHYYNSDLSGFRTDIEQAGHVWIDLNDEICPDGSCAPSRGGVITYLDNNHLTNTFGRTLAQSLANQVAPQVDWWPAAPYEAEKTVDRGIDE